MDFYILTGVKFINKLPTKKYRILLGSLIGSLSLILLFFKMSTIILNLVKIIISIFMVLISFGKKSFFNNLFYLYIISIVLGGSLYLINDSLGYKVNSFIFINNGYSINLVILLIISPIIILFYIKEHLNYKKRINTKYYVTIKFKNKEINVEGFLDTGNKLVDPYLKRPIILLNKKYINIKNKKVLYVPFSSLNNSGLLKCITCEYILIEDKKIEKVLIGICENLKADCILNERIFDL
ncbi:MAG: sigma-E processing peptidase SpoIIGA [Bacilli bacterium]|nr:sigma-E processing peptidase SpoIIGA [Bacilli bacterium]